MKEFQEWKLESVGDVMSKDIHIWHLNHNRFMLDAEELATLLPGRWLGKEWWLSIRLCLPS